MVWVGKTFELGWCGAVVGLVEVPEGQVGGSNLREVDVCPLDGTSDVWAAAAKNEATRSEAKDCEPLQAPFIVAIAPHQLVYYTFALRLAYR